jgi:hypothetical protein
MSDFSQSPQELLQANRNKGYTGLHIEQGVPVLDRDLNLLQDLLAAGVQSVFAKFLGDGAAADTDAFLISPTTPPSQDFTVSGPGSLLLGGVEVTTQADLRYSSQPGVPVLTTPAAPQPDPRVDTVYLEAWQTEVDDLADPDLGNPTDIGMRTSIRLLRVWVVLVAEGVPVPAAVPGHAIYPLAEIRRPLGQAAITAPMITDLRQTRLTVATLERRLSLLERVLLVPSFVPPGSGLPQFLPQTGAVGSTVQVNGSNLDVGDISVFFGGAKAQLVGTPTANQLAARVPGGLTPTGVLTPVRLTLRNQGGEQLSDDVFLVRPDPVFADRGSQFTPTHGLPGTQVTLFGFNFDIGAVRVTFSNGPLTVPATLVGAPSANRLTVRVPAGLGPPTKITVTTGAGTDVSDDSFQPDLNVPPPTFSPTPQFLPQTGTAGTQITLNGTNFNVPPVSVRFDPNDTNVTATIVGAPSATQIVVNVPAGIVTAPATKDVPITVTTGGGSVTSTDTIKVR